MLGIRGIAIRLVEIDLDIVDGVVSMSIGLERLGFTEGCGNSSKGLVLWEFNEEDVLVIHS
jgi:hypothetical protein